MRPGKRFMPFEAWQYNTRFPVTRLFHMRIDFAGFVPMIGRDAYVGGRGRMRGKLVGLVPVADGSGPEFDVSELVTWLNDAILLGPSMLLDDATSWSAVGNDAFDVSFTDGGTTVTARVLHRRSACPSNFSTTNRYAASRTASCAPSGRHPSRNGTSAAANRSRGRVRQSGTCRKVRSPM